MNLCSSRNMIQNIHKTEITKFLETLPYRNEINKFLILLNDKDFQSKCPFVPSLDHRIEYFNDFPGELKIAKFSAIENLDLKIEDTPLPKQLYILLHKEQLYIDIKNYESRLLNSKMDELTNIFMYLGANQIKTTKYYKTSKGEDISVGGGININQINVNLENSFGNENSNSSETSETMRFPENNDFKLNVLELYNYYYLPKMNDWQHIIKRRVDGLINGYKYEFVNKVDKKIRTKLVNKLKYLEISVVYDNKECLDIKKSFDVSFNPLTNENINFINKVEVEGTIVN